MSFRFLLSTFAGILVALVLVALFELLGHLIWPPPLDLDPKNPDSIRAAAAQMPMGALLSVAFAWMLGAFGGSWIGAKLSNSPISAYTVGAIIAIFGILNLLMIPFPTAFWLVPVVLIPLATYAAIRLSRTPI